METQQELAEFLFGHEPHTNMIQDWKWEDNNLLVWVYTFNINEFLQHFMLMTDGTNHIELHWVGDYICIDHFEDWLQDLDECDLLALFPPEDERTRRNQSQKK